MDAVLFDLDDTLFAHRAAVEAGLVAHLGGSDAIEDPEKVLDRWRELEERHYPRYLSGDVSFLEQRRVRAREFALGSSATLSTDADADAWFEAYLGRYREAWTLHDDALPCLDELRSRIPGVRIGIITNGELDFQTTKLEAVRLSDRVDAVIASGDVGVAKPQAEIFRIACRQLGVRFEAAAYVGDRLRTDAIGAAGAGLLGVWLDRRSEPATAEDLAEAASLGVVRVSSLDEVPEIIARPA
ncbi:MAG: hydrolase [Naasia sp.]|jgi:putative hydrolase of the HAD superfamily|uniref:HAD family hydrolase n=1 Tax=Naasia sp. TaxID=2546198 RepID=UPI00260358AF|nr:HAD family hydrolase [Naasia sp.]MCU1569893.1 hydrolase [Naasia sp.]